MSFIKQQYKRLQYFLLERKVRQTPIQRQPGDYRHSKKIGLLFDATVPENRAIVLDYAQSLRQQKKEVKLLAYYHAKKIEPNFTFKHFTLKELNFWGHPGSDSASKEFMAKPFDVLVNLFLHEVPALEYISALSAAQLRVGPYTERTYCYDLMIETKDPHHLKQYIQQVDFLLNKMNSTSHETTSA